MPPLPVKSSGVIFERAARKLGWHPFPAPMAILRSRAPGGALASIAVSVSRLDAKSAPNQSSLATAIRMAEKTGRCEIRPNS